VGQTIDTEWHQKSETRFRILFAEPKAGEGKRDRIYDQFTPEDRELFLTAKRSIPPQEMLALQREAMETGQDVDTLIFFQVFGPERQRKYANLVHDT
jgi:hypothetical protein